MKTTKKIKSNQINQELEKIIEESCKPELIQESGVISRPQEDPPRANQINQVHQRSNQNPQHEQRK